MQTQDDTVNIDSPSQPAMLERLIAALRRRFGGKRSVESIRDAAALRNFLRTRASYVAQMTLYGYLRTRAGTRLALLYEDEQFVVATNIAKWHVWLACLSDLSAYVGGMLHRTGGAPNADVGRLICRMVDEILAETGTPADAGPEFAEHAGRVRARLALCIWSAQTDDNAPFCESPGALVYWAPIVDVLKELDEGIVRNSIRFRWQEIRRELRQTLDAASVMATAGDGRAPPA
ncbi:MAG: esterase [Burkholderiales bacterium]|nr:esterase [Burkholderiales bacterium]